MTKKQRALRICLVIALVLLIFLVGYTFAKYYSEIKGGGTGSIAKWSFIANDSKDTIQTISLVDTANQVSLVEGKIAPGTKGSFNIEIDATGSEVGVDYDVNVSEETNLPMNLLYKVTIDGKTSKEYTSLTELAEENLSGTIDTINGEFIKDIIVHWEWPYETYNDYGVADGDLADLYDGTKIIWNMNLCYK